MSREQAARTYMNQLLLAYEGLEAEKARLLAAAERLTEIEVEKAALLDDAQAALAKYNSLAGTSYTLQQVRNALRPPTGTP